jgi:tRNA(Ile)-lysidine synthetase-like protein
MQPLQQFAEQRRDGHLKLLSTRKEFYATTSHHNDDDGSSASNIGHPWSQQRQQLMSSTSVSSLAQSIQSTIDDVLTAAFSSKCDRLVRIDQCRAKLVVQVVLSVSGGCDSVALLHACMEWWNNNSNNHHQQQESSDGVDVEFRNIHIVHFHHRQREDAEADGDCQLVQDIASSYNIPCHVEDWKNIQSSNDLETQTFSQDIARKWRRSKLVEYTHQQLMTSLNNADDDSDVDSDNKENKTLYIGLILTAHHVEDSQESTILKLLRGVHLLNLSGMEQTTCMSSGSNSEIILVRPLMQHTKRDLVQYLLDRRLEWREDSSNSSDKYLRNRVRNQLIPLLQDMTDGAFLSKRLPSMVRQSNLMAADLQPRVDAYLQQHLRQQGTSKTSSCFSLLDDDDEKRKTCDPSYSSLVFSQSLFQWISSEIMDKQGDDIPHVLGYEALERIIQQIELYPDRRQWTLDLGNKWTLTRDGSILRINHPKTSRFLNETDEREIFDTFSHWKWTTLPQESDLDENSDRSFDRTEGMENETTVVYVAADVVSSDLDFVSTTLGNAKDMVVGSPSNDCEEHKSSMWFTPSWRNSPIKLRQFLRAQGVPLHLRDEVPILIMKSGGDKTGTIVAVKPNEKWLVQKEFCYFPSTNQSSEGRTPTVKTALGVWASPENNTIE